MLRAVQLYQVARMRVTHEALFRTPHYRPLCEFFLTDLYGPRDRGASRASALVTLLDVLRPVLPRWIHEGSVGLIELHALSERLDDRLARELVAGGAALLFSVDEFESAYVRCDDYEDRVRQIALSEASTRFGHTLAQHGSVGRLLAIIHGIPSFWRVESLLSMLERGHRAFRGAGAIGPFVEAMRVGETAYLNGVYARKRG